MVRPYLITPLIAVIASVHALEDAKKFEPQFVPGAYIFEFEAGKDPSEFHRAAGKEGETRFKYDYELFKGVSVQLKGENAEERANQLASMPAIKNVWPVEVIRRPEYKVEWAASHYDGGSMEGSGSQSADKKIPYPPHVMTQIDKLHEKGITGKNIKIAVIDTGIDFKHKDLGGCFGKGCLVSFGIDLVGDNYTLGEAPVSGGLPMDCEGHGTHVAGIVAAKSNNLGFIGAAPGVTLGAYRVFGCTGNTGNDVLIDAWNRAYEDGAQIITASIGSVKGWRLDPVSVVVSRIVAKGVPCISSAGNNGGFNFRAGSPSSGIGVMSIGSVISTERPVEVYRVQYSVDGGNNKDFTFAPGYPYSWNISEPLSLYATNLDPNSQNDACGPLPDNTPDLSDKIVLIHRGGCLDARKIDNVASRNARYVLLFNEEAGVLPRASYEFENSVKAVGTISKELGQTFIRHLRDNKKVSLQMNSNWSANLVLDKYTNNQTGECVAARSSWGPTWELFVNPQYTAVGHDILSTYPRQKGSYAVLSGTSMAAPMAAGIVALISEARKTFDPALITSLLSANAKPKNFSDPYKCFDYLATVQQQGGGLLQAYDAAYAKTLIEPASIAFNDTDHFLKSANVSLRNTGDNEVTYEFSNVGAPTAYTMVENAPYGSVMLQDPNLPQASLDFSPKSVKLGPGQSATITVSATAPKGLAEKRLPIWSGYIAVDGSDGTALTLPYLGLAGSLYNATNLQPDNTQVYRVEHDRLVPVREGHLFTLPKPGTANSSINLPILTTILSLGSSQLHFYVKPVPTREKKSDSESALELTMHKSLKEIFSSPIKYMTSDFIQWGWDGHLESGEFAPAGEYVLIVRALRLFGNAKKDSDFIYRASRKFKIRYE